MAYTLELGTIMPRRPIDRGLSTGVQNCAIANGTLSNACPGNTPGDSLDERLCEAESRDRQTKFSQESRSGFVKFRSDTVSVWTRV